VNAYLLIPKIEWISTWEIPNKGDETTGNSFKDERIVELMIS
jgi:hypothetical protein